MAVHGSGLRYVIATTRNLLIRPLRLSDSASISTHLNNADVLRYLGGRKMHRGEHKRFVEWLRSQQRRNGTTLWPVERRSDGMFLGLCGLVRIDEFDSTVCDCVEIGWRFRADMHRHGAAEEAARACLNYAFRVLRVGRLVSRTIEANVPSIALMRRIGMRHDSRLDYVADDGDRFVVYVRTAAEGPVEASRRR